MLPLSNVVGLVKSTTLLIQYT